jgi:sugar lactone lactonase YvrE
VLSKTNFETGARSILASEFGGAKLTSPNDVIQSRNTGHIYFTDPDYGCMPALGHGKPQDQDICQ